MGNSSPPPPGSHHVGRALLSEILPRGLSFDIINQDMTKRPYSACINACYRRWV